jgi:hypothetical protein
MSAICCFILNKGWVHDWNASYEESHLTTLFLVKLTIFMTTMLFIIWADNNRAMNLARNPEFHACINTLTYNITLFVKLLIVTLLTLNLYLSSSKQQMGLLRLCLLSSLAVFLFSQVLYLINDLSLCIQTSLLLTFLCHLLHSHFLTSLLWPSSHSHYLAVELTFSEIEELYTG